MNNEPTTNPDDAKAESREPLGRRNRADVNKTVLRVVGRESKAPALDVAAFQSFAE